MCLKSDRKQRYVKTYVTNALMAVRERPSIRIELLRFYASTSTSETQHSNLVVFKTVDRGISKKILRAKNVQSIRYSKKYGVKYWLLSFYIEIFVLANNTRQYFKSISNKDPCT